MRIAIDCSHHLIPGGVRTVIENLLTAMVLREPGNEYLLHYRRLRIPDDPIPLPPDARVRKILVRAPRRLLSFLENTFGLPPVELWTGALDVFHGTHFILPPSRRSRRILTVHDAAYLRNPALYGDPRYGEYNYRYLLPNALRRADLVLASSDSTRRDLIEFFHLKEDAVWVSHLGTDPRFAPVGTDQKAPVLGRLGIGRPYVLYPVGTMELRKNLGRTLEAFAAAFPQRADRPLLVFTGVGGDLVRLMEDASRLGLDGDLAVHRVKYPDDLAALMSGALWGMYLSLYEGFGLPVLESMACGLPMVVSKASSLPEVAGGDAVLVDPDSTEEIAAAMRMLQEDEALRRDLSARGRRRATSHAFSWDRAARQTLAAYRGDRKAFDAVS